MFHNNTSLDRCVIVELKGVSADCLTSNRDGLTSTYRHELSEFLTSLSVDKRSALKNRLQELKEANELEKKQLESQVSTVIHSQAGHIAAQRQKITMLQSALQDELAMSQNRIAEQVAPCIDCFVFLHKYKLSLYWWYLGEGN
jgi:hypothetical protein